MFDEETGGTSCRNRLRLPRLFPHVVNRLEPQAVAGLEQTGLLPKRIEQLLSGPSNEVPPPRRRTGIDPGLCAADTH